MTASAFLRLTTTFAFTSLLALFPFAGCGGEGDDGGDGGTESGGSATGGESNSGGSGTGGDSSTGGATGGSGAGGSTATGGDSATGGQAGSIFGDPCTEETECPMRGELNGNCNTSWPGGYCTAACSFFGDCGPGNVCDMGFGDCLKACESDDDCREGYECSDDFKGCQPEFL